jgi:hypothetical protein
MGGEGADRDGGVVWRDREEVRPGRGIRNMDERGG